MPYQKPHLPFLYQVSHMSHFSCTVVAPSNPAPAFFTARTDEDFLKGFPPIWKDQEFPISLLPLEQSAPPDQHPDAFNLLMLSAQHTSSDFRHNQVDIVTSISTLGKLLRFCKGERFGAYRFSLRTIQGSLFLAHGTSFHSSGDTDTERFWSAVMKRCTKFSPGLEHSTHYRSVQYSLGNLNCVVQSKVDALCDTFPGQLQPLSFSSPSPVVSGVSQAYPLHSEAAMMQVRLAWKGFKGLSAAAFWLSRIPFLLRPRISADGDITRVSKIDAASAARKWEEKETNQLALRKLVTLLSDLKRAVKAAAPDGQECIGLIERHTDPLMVQVFLSEDESAVPGDISNNLWGRKTSHGPDEASNGEGGDSTCQAKPSQDKASSNTHNQTAQ